MVHVTIGVKSFWLGLICQRFGPAYTCPLGWSETRGGLSTRVAGLHASSNFEKNETNYLNKRFLDTYIT